MEVAKGLIETLKSICHCFGEVNIEFCLIGGLAVGILARPRATEDIDLLVLIDDKKKKLIRDLLQDKFKVVKINNEMHFKKATIWRIILQDTFTNDNGLIVVDLIFADNEVYKETVSNHIKIEIDGIEIPVATPENLIKIKRLSNRPQDIIDIEALKEENFD